MISVSAWVFIWLITETVHAATLLLRNVNHYTFTLHVLVQKCFVFSHAIVIVLTLSISLLLLHFNISSSGMNSVIDTCKLGYFMSIKLLVCNSTTQAILLNFTVCHCWAMYLNLSKLLKFIFQKNSIKCKHAGSKFKPFGNSLQNSTLNYLRVLSK